MKKQWIGLLACLALGQAQAASFDCAKACTKVEKMICANADLSKLDEQLAKAYKDGAKRTTEPDRYKREQRSWLKAREACLSDTNNAAACLSEQYTRRVQALSGNCWRHKSWQIGKGDTVSGKNWPMCRIMLENLNRFCHEDPKAMECGLKIDPGITSLKTPDWQPIDPKAHLGWIEESVKWRYGIERGPDVWGWKALKPEILRRIEAGEARMWQATFDVSNDGVQERVRRLELGCSDIQGKDPDGTLYVLSSTRWGLANEHTGELDKRYMFGGHILRNAGKTYLLRGQEHEWELAEPFGGYRGGFRGTGAERVYGDTTVCMFERVAN